MPDFTTLRQMTLGDESLFISVLNQFQDETAADLEKLGEKNTIDGGRPDT